MQFACEIRIIIYVIIKLIILISHSLHQNDEKSNLNKIAIRKNQRKNQETVHGRTA